MKRATGIIIYNSRDMELKTVLAITRKTGILMDFTESLAGVYETTDDMIHALISCAAKDEVRFPRRIEHGYYYYDVYFIDEIFDYYGDYMPITSEVIKSWIGKKYNKE